MRKLRTRSRKAIPETRRLRKKWNRSTKWKEGYCQEGARECKRMR
jgi:hypothetical protein